MDGSSRSADWVVTSRTLPEPTTGAAPRQPTAETTPRLHLVVTNENPPELTAPGTAQPRDVSADFAPRPAVEVCDALLEATAPGAEASPPAAAAEPALPFGDASPTSVLPALGRLRPGDRQLVEARLVEPPPFEAATAPEAREVREPSLSMHRTVAPEAATDHDAIVAWPEPALPFGTTPAAAVPSPAVVLSAPSSSAEMPPRKRRLAGVGRVARIAAYGLGVWYLAMLALIVTYRWVDPPVSAFMIREQLAGHPVKHTWRPLERIAPQLVTAVVLSEDSRFCSHHGVDLAEARVALERLRDGAKARGASTITMQVAKNLFLWSEKSYLRKALELPLTFTIEAFWPKWRIAEVYLNIAQWGPGVYGAEAAANYHFGKPAFRLGEHESALLAVSLPAPLAREPEAPTARTAKLAARIRSHMHVVERPAACLERRLEQTARGQ
jgi:monofunctional glycosyltransferase